MFKNFFNITTETARHTFRCPASKRVKEWVDTILQYTWWGRTARPWIEKQKNYYKKASPYARGIMICVALIIATILAGIGAGLASGLNSLASKVDAFVASYSADQRVECYFRVLILVFAAALLVEFCGNRKFRIEILAVSAVVALLLISPVGPAVIDSFKTAIDWLRNPSLHGIDAGAEWLWEAIKEWVTAPLR